MDNYLRLSKRSVLDTFYKDMKVVDYISEKTGKDKKNDEKKVEEKKEVEEKKDK